MFYNRAGLRWETLYLRPFLTTTNREIFCARGKTQDAFHVRYFLLCMAAVEQ